MMRRVLLGLLGVSFVAIAAMTIHTLVKAFSFDYSVPAASWEDQNRHRLVLISRERDTPFWNELEQGAAAAAERHGVSLEAWGTVGLNEGDFLRNVELAIASRVDGIIAQGLDADAFKRLTAIRAAEYGIPVITVGNDVPVAESMRRTYVGSNHREAGRMLARQLVADMGTEGRVVLLASGRLEHDERERLAGILSVTGRHPGIVTEVAEAGVTREDTASAVRDQLNAHPDTKAILSVAYNNAEVVAREIRKRTRAEDFYLYAFDESPETLELLREGIINGLIIQDPHRMGEWSVDLMVRWLEGIDLPLDMEGYHTDIRVLTREDLP